MNQKKHILTNTAWLYFEKVYRLFVGLFTTALIARYFGPKDFGLLSYATTIILFLEPFSVMGLNSILRREFVLNADSAGKLIGTSTFARFLLCSIFILSFICYALFAVEDKNLSILLIILSFSLLFKAFDFFEVWFESQMQSRTSTVIKTIALTISSALKLIAIYLELPLYSIAILNVLDLAIISAGYIFFFRKKHFPIKQLKFSIQKLKTLLSESWPLMFSSIAVLIYMRIDQVMLKSMLGEEPVGIYSVSVRLCEVLFFIPLGFVRASFPNLMKSFEESSELFSIKMKKILTILIYSSFIIALCTTLLSDFIIVNIFSQSFAQSADVLRIQIWSSIFVFIGVCQNPWDITHGLIRFSLLRTILGALINISLNLVLIPKHGVLGAAYATLISQFFVSSLINLFSFEGRKFVVLQLKALNPIPLLRDYIK